MGISEILIVRGCLGEQFDQRLAKYPTIMFLENPVYNKTDNISSVMCVRYLLSNCYVLEAVLILRLQSSSAIPLHIHFPCLSWRMCK